MKRFCLHLFNPENLDTHGLILSIFDAKTKKDAVKLAKARFDYDGKDAKLRLSQLSFFNMFFSKNLPIVGPCDHPKFEAD